MNLKKYTKLAILAAVLGLTSCLGLFLTNSYIPNNNTAVSSLKYNTPAFQSKHTIQFHGAQNDSDANAIIKEVIKDSEVNLELLANEKNKHDNYLVDRYDINSDGHDEIFLFENVDAYCGMKGACPLRIFKRDALNSTWKPILFDGNDYIISLPQVSILLDENHSYYDLAFLHSDGLYGVWTYNSGAYKISATGVQLN